MKKTQQHDALEAAANDQHVKSKGKNFQPLIEAGSWTISGFFYGRSKCACCGRPITRTLQLKNESHDVNSSFTQVIDVGIVCGPKVFIESCVGFYSDPAREWERQHKAWKDYINYIILCVKHEKMWSLIPTELRQKIDNFLQEGYKTQAHSGGWWMVKDAKKRYLKSQKQVDVIPRPDMLTLASRGLIIAARRQGLITGDVILKCDSQTGEFTLDEKNQAA